MVTKKIYDDYELLNNAEIYQYYNKTHPSKKCTLFSLHEFIQYMIIAILEVFIFFDLTRIGYSIRMSYCLDYTFCFI